MLNGQIIAEWTGVRLPKHIRTQIAQIVSWNEKVPSFPSVGRTAFLSLPTPISVVGASGKAIRSLKIKGVGLQDYSGTVSLPSTTPYYRANMHIGFDNAGKSTLVASDPSPLGGMTLPRAQAEFDCAKELFESGCPAELPVALATYPDLEFFDPVNLVSSKLGAVVCGLPVEAPTRLNDLLSQSRESTDSDSESTDQEHYELLRRIYLNLGTTLRRFHMSGFYRYSGHPGNFIFDSKKKEVLLVDLDSSQRTEKLLMPALQLYLVRDIASAIYHLGAYVLRADTIASWGYTAEQSVELMTQVIHGYLINENELFLNSFKEKYLPTYAQAVAIAPERHTLACDTAPPSVVDYQAYRNSILHHYWVDREEHFSKLMSLLSSSLCVYGNDDKFLVLRDDLR